MTKNYVCRTTHLRRHTSYDHDLEFPDAFFIFFKVWIFSVVREVKEQKMAQNDKKFCLFHSLSQELSLLWLWVLLNMYKIMISPAICFIFSKFWFYGCFFFWGGWGVKEQKVTHNYPFQSVTLCISITVDIIKIFGTQV